MEPFVVAKEVENLRKSITEMEQTVKNLNDKIESQWNWWIQLGERLNRDMTDTKEMVKDLSGEVKNARTDSQNYFQSLVSRMFDGSNVIVLEDTANCNVTPHEPPSQGQDFTIPTVPASTTFEQAKESDVESVLKANDADLDSREIGKEINSTGPQQIPNGRGDNLRQLVEAISLRYDDRMKEVPMHNNIGSAIAMDGTKAQGTAEAIGNVAAVASHDNNDGLPPPVNLRSEGCVGSHHNNNTVLSTAENFNDCNKNSSTNGQYHIRLPEKKFYCPYCPRLFEHNHSIALHIRACKKKHERAFQKPAVHHEKNHTFTDLAIFNPTKPGLPLLGNNHVTEGVTKVLEKMIKCGYCERSFPTLHQVKSHERVHTGNRPYFCYVCRIKFAHGGNMIKHIKSKHPNENPYACRHCIQNFKTYTEVQAHRKICAPPRSSRKRKELIAQVRKSGRESEETITASESEENSCSLPPPPLSMTATVADLKPPGLTSKDLLNGNNTDSNSNINNNCGDVQSSETLPEIKDIKMEICETSQEEVRDFNHLSTD